MEGQYYPGMQRKQTLKHTSLSDKIRTDESQPKHAKYNLCFAVSNKFNNKKHFGIR